MGPRIKTKEVRFGALRYFVLGCNDAIIEIFRKKLLHRKNLNDCAWFGVRGATIIYYYLTIYNFTILPVLGFPPGGGKRRNGV